MDEDSSTDKKLKQTRQVYSFGNRNVFRLHLTESRAGFYRNGEGHSMLTDQKNRKGAGTKSGEPGASTFSQQPALTVSRSAFSSSRPHCQTLITYATVSY